MDELDSPFSGPSLSEQEALEVAAEQKEICTTLFVLEITDANDIPDSKIESVRTHLATCGENHYLIRGL